MKFRIEEGNLIVAMHTDEEIPLYGLLLDFLNFPLSNLYPTHRKRLPFREDCLWKLISKFEFRQLSILSNHADKLMKELRSLPASEEREAKINDLKMNGLKDEKVIITNKFAELQNKIINMVEACFIHKKFDPNFGGIDVQGINYEIFFSAKYGDFGESYEISDIDTFCLFLIVKLLKDGVNIKKCENCSDYFVPKTMNEIYCDKIYPNGRTCKLMGYENKIKKEDNQIMYEYRKAYKNHNAVMNRTKHTGPKAEERWNVWKIIAKEKLKECQDGIITLDEFKEWLTKE